jgi:mono/diheme cytochrome c family protein
MRRLRDALRSPLGTAALVVIGAYLLIDFGIRWIPELLGLRSAPVPNSVVLQFMFIVLVGVLLHVSGDETRWRDFRRPLHATLVDKDKRWLRVAGLVLIPLGLGAFAWDTARPKVVAPIQLRSIHPAPPGSITFRGKTIQLTGLENPLRTRGDMKQHLATGKRVYYQNCLACHGDRFDGQGHYGHGFNPTPLAFNDNGTIAQLTEAYVFWRVAKGGLGLPREGTPWNSAMPVWENFLTEDEIWATIIYLYDQTGWKPRTWHEAGATKAGGAH